MTDELTEARAEIAALKKALRECKQVAWDALRIQGVQELSDKGKTYGYGKISEISDNLLAATPSDCLKQIRAEVLEEAAAMFDDVEWVNAARRCRELKYKP